MKKVSILAALTLLLVSFNAFSHSPLPIGRSQLNVGVGLSEWGIPIYIGIDHSVHKDITLGAEFSYRSYNENWKNNYYRHNIMGFSGNANYHFNSLLHIPTNWDFYAGANLGFYSWNSPKNYDGNRTSGLGISGQIGGRYYFSNTVGVNLEFGGGNAFSGGKLGISIKL